MLANGAKADLTLNSAVTSISSGLTVVLSAGQHFINNVGGAAVNPGSGNYLVYSSDLPTDTAGVLVPAFIQYNTAPGGSVTGSGNGFVYSVAAPTPAPTPTPEPEPVLPLTPRPTPATVPVTTSLPIDTSAMSTTDASASSTSGSASGSSATSDTAVSTSAAVNPTSTVKHANSPTVFTQLMAQQHQERSLRYQEALTILNQNPAAAALKICDKNGGADEVCIPDLKCIKLPLQRAGGEIKRKLVSTLRQLTESKEQDESVLLFYAGYGYQSEDNGMGFWIPADASAADPATWLSNSDIGKFLAAIPARQVMLVSGQWAGLLQRQAGRVINSIRGYLFKTRSLAESSGADKHARWKARD